MFSQIELTMLRKVDTKLPVNLWIDENSEHKCRLMFQNNTSDIFTAKRDLIPISVEDCPLISVKDNTLKISSEQMKAVQTFISLNKEILLKYMNDTNFGMKDFFAAMKVSSV